WIGGVSVADDNISYDVIVDFVMRNAASSVKEIEQFQDRLNALTNAGKVTEDQYNATMGALNRMGSAFKAGLGGVDRYTKGFRGLTTELQTAQREFARLAQTAVARGSNNPFAVKSTQIDLKDAQRYVAIQEAANANLVNQSRKVIAAEKQKQAAAKQAADEAVKGAERAEQATKARLQAEYNLARYRASNATKSSMAQWDAEFKSLSTAADEATRAIRDQENALPRLRYALDDVSSTLTIAGAGMLALSGAVLGLATKMDREFADVVRTTEVYLDDTGAAARELRAEFDQLFSTMPASWGDLTEIGTLAGQLNIAS